jgi:hypothetical protein
MYSFTPSAVSKYPMVSFSSVVGALYPLNDLGMLHAGCKERP